jgi:hypothetical protein
MIARLTNACLAVVLSASCAFAAASEEAAPKDAKGEGKSEEAGGSFEIIPQAGNPGVEDILEAARAKLVKKTQRENDRRSALKEEAERQKKVRQSLKDAGVNLEYLPEPEAMKQVREMTSPEVREEPDRRPEELYSKIEKRAQSGSSGMRAEFNDQREVLLRVLCNEKGSEPDGRTLSELKLDAQEARRLQAELCGVD